MVSRFLSTLGSLTHSCSEFGNYFMSFQRGCLNSCRSGDCEGNPSLEEAQRDYREMLRPWKTPFVG